MTGFQTCALPIYQFHDDVEFAVSLADIVDGADVGMREGRGGAGFMEQTLAGRRVEPRIFLDDFDSHLAVKHFVVGAIDNAHTTFADLGDDAAMAENLADHEQTPPLIHARLRFGKSSTKQSAARSVHPTGRLLIVDF